MAEVLSWSKYHMAFVLNGTAKWTPPEEIVSAQMDLQSVCNLTKGTR